jgi:hypothetical protein
MKSLVRSAASPSRSRKKPNSARLAYVGFGLRPTYPGMLITQRCWVWPMRYATPRIIPSFQRQLTGAGHDCVVVAPSLIQPKPGDAVAARSGLITKPRFPPSRASFTASVFKAAGVVGIFPCSRSSPRKPPSANVTAIVSEMLEDNALEIDAGEVGVSIGTQKGPPIGTQQGPRSLRIV